jgi:hypothetical protein
VIVDSWQSSWHTAVSERVPGGEAHLAEHRPGRDVLADLGKEHAAPPDHVQLVGTVTASEEHLAGGVRLHLHVRDKRLERVVVAC